MATLSIDGYAPREKLADTDLLSRVLGEYLPELGMRILEGAAPFISPYHTEEGVVNYSGVVLLEAPHYHLTIHAFQDTGLVWIDTTYDPNKKPEDAVAYFEKHLGLRDAKAVIHGEEKVA